MTLHAHCRCHPAVPKMRRPEQRRRLKALLAALASLPDDLLSHKQMFNAWRRLPDELGGDLWQFGSHFAYLRWHGFVRPHGRVKTGSGTRWYLSEQAIRWLDWTGFKWGIWPAESVAA